MNSATAPLPPTRVERLARPVRAALQHPWVAAIVRESAVEDSLRALHPLLSLQHVRGRVVKRIQETADTVTLVMQPNALWRGAQAGQYVGVTVEIDGRRTQRMYSLTSRPGSRRVALTVKRQGRVSGHLHDHVAVGSVLTLSPAMGEFVLPGPATLPQRLLLLGAGSGITPVKAMLDELAARRYTGSVVLVHLCRTPQDAIFAAELRGIGARLPGLRLVEHFSASQGRFSWDELCRQVPDLARRATWACGPAGLLDSLHTHWHEAVLTVPLHTERFGTPPRAAAPLSRAVRVTLALSQRGFDSLGASPLLEQAEASGLAPKHGCRIGICRSCQCLKRSGTVQDLNTGELHSAPNELIRLCVSAARSDLELDL